MLTLASPDDIPAIRTLAQRIWHAHYPPIIGLAQVEYMLGLFYAPDVLRRQMVDEGQQFWLVRDGAAEEPAGFVAVSRRGDDSYFIHKFYLDNERRGRGLGSRTFAELLEAYPTAREIRLTVNRCNYTSINFYFKNGFTIEQCVDIPIGGGFTMEDFQMVWRGREV
jgi:ribosomal protein S18 acetylase RimI-like enzyme